MANVAKVIHTGEGNTKKLCLQYVSAIRLLLVDIFRLVSYWLIFLYRSPIGRYFYTGLLLVDIFIMVSY